MRGALLSVWLLLPLLGLAYHHGPGQERLQLDDVQAVLDQARADADGEEWPRAAAGFEEALRLLPASDRDAARRVRIELARARMQSGGLPDAHDDLIALVDELGDDPGADPQLMADARLALASAQFYVTWLMRLEGQPRSAWEPVIEASRQNYRLLAEETVDPIGRAKHQEDLAAAVRLSRMDLGQLEGLPLPNQ